MPRRCLQIRVLISCRWSRQFPETFLKRFDVVARLSRIPSSARTMTANVSEVPPSPLSDSRVPRRTKRDNRLRNSDDVTGSRNDRRARQGQRRADDDRGISATFDLTRSSELLTSFVGARDYLYSGVRARSARLGSLKSFWSGVHA